MKIYRHGDVILRLAELPDEKKQISSGKQYTAALGEATGHHHTFYASADGAVVAWEGFNEARYVEIAGDVVLKHQEHHALSIEPGCYEIIIKREYDYAEEEMRNVVD